MIRASAAALALALLCPADSRADGVCRTTNFLVDSSDPAAASRAALRCEAARVEFARVWLPGPLGDWTVQAPVVVYVSPDKPGGREFTIGRRFQVVEVWGHDAGEAESYLPHEVGHVVIDKEVGHVPRWMHEGACVAFEALTGPKPTRYGRTVGRAPLRDLLPAEGIPWSMNGDAFYNQGASLLLFMRDTWGPDAPWELYRAARYAGWELGVEVALGVTLDDFERMWTESLGQDTCPYP